MNEWNVQNLRTELTERREKLVAVTTQADTSSQVWDLLHQVDAALSRIDNGSFGVCQSCHGTIEDERLLVDPLVTFCLDCLTVQQQRDLEEDLELASSIQNTLLPRKDFQRDGWRISYHYQPAGLVSGDYCDLIPLGDGGGDTLFVLGDVSGKGVAASMLMSSLHAMFHSLAGLELPLTELVERANRLFCESTQTTHYTTLVCGRLYESGRVQLCNAGHCPPVLVSAGKVDTLPATGLPIGLFCNSHYTLREFDLQPGDNLLLYTDGVNEAMYEGEEYGLDRIAGLAGDMQGRHSDKVIEVLLADVARFDHNSPKADDLTVMAIHRL